jgi:DNA-binding IclR family transcriptional regulator
MSKQAKNPVRSLEKSLEIVEVLDRVDRIGVTELAERIGAGKSTVHNHLSTLEENEYVVREGDKYRLGLKFLDLGGHARKKMDLYRVAEPEVEKLARETGEEAILATEEYGRCVYLYRAKGETAIDLDFAYEGVRTDIHCTSLGKAMLAFMDERRVEGILDANGLPRRTSNTITDRAEFLEELERTRERGFALDDEEAIEGIRCVASPITTDQGEVLGSISVSGPTSRMQGRRWKEELPELVGSATNVVEVSIQYA